MLSLCERKEPEKESRCHLVNHTCISNDGDVLCCNEETRGTAPGSGDVALGGVVKAHTPPLPRACQKVDDLVCRNWLSAPLNTPSIFIMQYLDVSVFMQSVGKRVPSRNARLIALAQGYWSCSLFNRVMVHILAALVCPSVTEQITKGTE